MHRRSNPCVWDSEGAFRSYSDRTHARAVSPRRVSVLPCLDGDRPTLFTSRRPAQANFETTEESLQLQYCTRSSLLVLSAFVGPMDSSCYHRQSSCPSATGIVQVHRLLPEPPGRTRTNERRRKPSREMIQRFPSLKLERRCGRMSEKITRTVRTRTVSTVGKAHQCLQCHAVDTEKLGLNEPRATYGTTRGVGDCHSKIISLLNEDSNSLDDAQCGGKPMNH